MSKLKIYGAELEVEYNRPILNKENHGTEELIGAYRDNDNDN